MQLNWSNRWEMDVHSYVKMGSSQIYCRSCRACKNIFGSLPICMGILWYSRRTCPTPVQPLLVTYICRVGSRHHTASVWCLACYMSSSVIVLFFCGIYTLLWSLVVHCLTFVQYSLVICQLRVQRMCCTRRRFWKLASWQWNQSLPNIVLPKPPHSKVIFINCMLFVVRPLPKLLSGIDLLDRCPCAVHCHDWVIVMGTY